MYDQIGQGGLSREGDYAAARRARPRPDSPAARAEREQEIRQMLGARSERLRAHAASRRSTSTPRWRGCSSRRRARASTTPALDRGGPPARDRAQRTARAPGPRAARRRGRGGAHAGGARSVNTCRARVGYKRAMTNARRFQLDELTLRPGTYFNPQTEIMIVVDDSPEVDHEIFESDEFESRRVGADLRGRPARRAQARRARRALPAHPPGAARRARRRRPRRRRRGRRRGRARRRRRGRGRRSSTARLERRGRDRN